MKNFPLILFFVLIFAFIASAQTDQTTVCPEISVVGGGVTETGSLSFKVDIGNYDLNKLSFNWTVSTGGISEGQGTLRISVKDSYPGSATGLFDSTATVEIKGLPEGCPTIFSETGSQTIDVVRPVLFDQFSIQLLRIDKARIDALVNEAASKPNSQMYIVEYFKRGTSQNLVKQKIQKITYYLANQRRVEIDRFTIVTDLLGDKNLTKFWIVPPGAYNPPLR